jgi:hypothetical protein
MKGAGYGSVLLGALVGNVVAGGLGSIPLLLEGARLRDLPVVFFLGYIHYYLGWNALLMMLCTVAGGGLGAWAALQLRGCARPVSSAALLVVIELGMSVAAILLSIAFYGTSPQLYLILPAVLALAALLVLAALVARAIDLWWGRRVAGGVA